MQIKPPVDTMGAEEMMQGILTSAEQRYETKSNDTPSFSDWCLNSGIILDGNPFTFTDHEYLREAYTDPHPFTVNEKAGQLGLTTKTLLAIIYYSRYMQYRGILYFLATRTDVTETSKGRMDPLIEENPFIKEWMKDTNAANIKHIWNAMVYFRGMKSRLQVKNVPGDFIIFDELDEAPLKNVEFAMERLAHSKFARVEMHSNPSLPGYGINKVFNETDQRYWMIKCQRCGEWTCMEDTFPNCLLEIDGRVIRACVKCQSEIDPRNGEWVPKCPSVTDKRGRHFSQLFSLSPSPFVQPAYILKDFRTTSHIDVFWNMKVGLPYATTENILPIEMIYDLCGSEGISQSDRGPCTMGVDQGKGIHVVIGKKDPEVGRKIIHLEAYKDFEQLDPLMDQFRISRCVIDGQPETRKAREFAFRHKGRVYLWFNNEHQKGSYMWDDTKLIVQARKTEEMDASHSTLLKGLIILPNRNLEIVQEFAKHVHNTARKLEEDEETGSKSYVYVRRGPDHFRRAFSYEQMAWESISQSQPTSVKMGISVAPETIFSQMTEQRPEVPERFKWIEE
jgi:hypothetical protein